MAWNLTVKTPPATEPITLTEAKAHLRVDFTDDDTYITSLITAARTMLEWTYDRALVTQTLVLGLDRFATPGWTPSWQAGWSPQLMGTYSSLPTFSIIELRPPVQAINAITYLDGTATLQTLDPTRYVLDKSESGRVFPAFNKIWPVTAYMPGAVSIEFVAGHGNAAAVPENMKSAIKLILGDLYENREQSVIEPRVSAAVELPLGVDELMAPWDRRRAMVR